MSRLVGASDGARSRRIPSADPRGGTRIGRDAREPAGGPVAFYELTCTVSGVPDVLVGTTEEPRLEIGRDPAAWGQVFEDCVVQAFGEDGYSGPPSEPSDESFRFLPDLDVDGDAVVSSPDLVRVMTLVGQGRRDVRDLGLLRRMFGCRVDPTSRTYVDCTSGGDPAP